MNHVNLTPLGRLTSSSEEPAQRERTLAPDDLWRAITDRPILVVGIIIATMVAGMLLVVCAPVRYAATASIMLTPRQDHIVDSTRVVEQAAPDTTLLESEIQVLESRALAGRVVLKLGLEKQARFQGANNQGMLAQLKALFSRAPAERPSPVQVATDYVASAVNTSRIAESYALNIKARASTPKEAALLANTMADAYVDYQVETRIDSTKRANQWLSARLSDLQKNVEGKEAAVAQYRAQSGLMQAEGATLTEQRVKDIQASVLAARADLAEREARFRQVDTIRADGGSQETIAAALGSETIRELRAREGDAARILAELNSRYGAKHPAVLDARAKLVDTRERITLEVARITTSLKNEVEVARSRLATLESSLNTTHAQLVNNNGDLVRLNELERDAAATREVYDSYLRRSQEITDQESLRITDARLISNAIAPPRPDRPSLPLTAVFCLLIGAIAGAAAAIAGELFSDKLTRAEDVAHGLGVEPLVSVPALKPVNLAGLFPRERHPAGFLARNYLSAYAEAFRVLWLAVRRDRPRGGAVIAVTSALAGEGKTTVSLSLARVAAIAGEKVLIIDCDMRRRSLSALMEAGERPGIGEVLSRESAWRSVMMQDPETSLFAIPAAASNASRMLDGAVLNSVLEEARQEFGLIVLDCPPVMMLADARIVAASADCTVVVARWRSTSSRAVRTAVEQITKAGGHVLGIALNSVDPRRPGRASYGDSLYYGRAAAGYYTG